MRLVIGFMSLCLVVVGLAVGLTAEQEGTVVEVYKSPT